MRKIQILLTGVLAFQALLAGGLLWNDAYTAQSKNKSILFGFEQEEITRVEISNENDTTILNKSDQKWVLPDLHKLPVNEDKILKLLDKLAQLNPGWPVATTKESFPRFEVADDKFQRKVKIFKDNDLIEEFFVGTSPNFRKGHVRKINDNAIYSIPLNSYELPIDNAQWLDTSLLAVKDITEIKGKDFILRNRDGKWNIEPLGENIGAIYSNSKINEDKVKSLVSVLTSLRILGIATEDNIINERQVKSIDVTGTSSWRYELLEKDEKYYIRRNDIATLFTMSKQNYDLLSSIELSQLTNLEKNIDSETKG